MSSKPILAEMEIVYSIIRKMWRMISMRSCHMIMDVLRHPGVLDILSDLTFDIYIVITPCTWIFIRFFCLCHHGYENGNCSTGKFCNALINRCETNNPCRNGGKCIAKSTGGFKCLCSKYWTGLVSIHKVCSLQEY